MCILKKSTFFEVFIYLIHYMLHNIIKRNLVLVLLYDMINHITKTIITYLIKQYVQLGKGAMHPSNVVVNNYNQQVIE